MAEAAQSPTLDEALSDASLEAARQRGDALADPLIQRISDEHGGAERVKRLLRDLALAPDVAALAASPEAENAAIRPILQEYVERSGQLPPWKDDRLIEKAEHFFQEHGFVAFLLLGAACLPELYTCGNGGTQVLEVTHALMEGARRRIHQTAHIITNVMAPGGLKDSASPGVRSIQKVRLMHAAVRHLALAAPPPPQPEAPGTPAGISPQGYQQLSWERPWGTPIGQEYMAGTLQTFSYVILRGMRDLGVIKRHVAEDQRPHSESVAYVHAWNVAGYVLGVEEPFLLSVRTYADAGRLFDTVMARNVSRTPVQRQAGVALTQALVQYMQSLIDDQTLGALELIPGLRLPHRVPKYMIRKMIGRERAALLVSFDALDKALYGGWDAAVTLLTHGLVRTRLRSLLRKLLALDIYANICLLDRGGCPPEFTPPQNLMRLWDHRGATTTEN